jgi:chorismate mutase
VGGLLRMWLEAVVMYEYLKSLLQHSSADTEDVVAFVISYSNDLDSILMVAINLK